ncbi:hypothetical protein AOLI_G00135500 [Acnodon oligacanthus]
MYSHDNNEWKVCCVGYAAVGKLQPSVQVDLQENVCGAVSTVRLCGIRNPGVSGLPQSHWRSRSASALLQLRGVSSCSLAAMRDWSFGPCEAMRGPLDWTNAIVLFCFLGRTGNNISLVFAPQQDGMGHKVSRTHKPTPKSFAPLSHSDTATVSIAAGT